MIRACVVAAFVLGFWSCDSARIYEVNTELNDQNWLADSVKQYSFSISDTLSAHNILCNIRNSGSYPFRNIYVKYMLLDSSGSELSGGLVNRELFEAKSGKPTGKGLGDVQDHSFPLVDNYTFPYKGNYHVSIAQYMRRDTLPNIVAVGVRVERALDE